MLRRTLTTALIIIGFTTTLAQIMLLREMAVVFYGNELTLGVFLAFWLFWTGVGSSILGRWADRLKQPIPVFAALQALVAGIILAEIFLVRCTRIILGIGHGVTIGLGPMLLASFCILLPLCLLTGFLFALGCKVYASEKERLGQQVGQVYIFDGIGDVLAGICFTYFLVYYFHTFHLVLYLIVINLFAGFLVLQAWNKRVILLKAGFIFSLVLCGAGIFMSGDKTLDRLSKLLQWQGYKLVDSQDSIYGNVAVTQEQNQYSFYENGLPLFSIPNQVVAEELIHLALVEHPWPKRILLIGGGVGLLKEVIKHPVEKVYYVDLDPLVLKITRNYLSNKEIKAIKRCCLWYGDGRFFVKRTKEKFDLILVNLPDPSTAQLNRFYTREFFQEAMQVLAANGIISVSMTSNENYLSQEMREYNACIYKTLKGVFPYCVLSPGDRLFLFASPQANVVSDNPSLLARRFMERRVNTSYVNQYYFANRFYPERIAFIRQELETEQAAKINRDFYPVCYYYDLVLWSSQFYPNLKRLFGLASKFNLSWLTAILGFLVILQIIVSAKKPGIHRASIPIAIVTTGFAGMALEIVLLFVFQVLYGYVYHRLGLIIAAFMAGLVLGTFYMNRRLKFLSSRRLALCTIETAIFAYCFLLPLIFLGLSCLKSEAGLFTAVEILFPLLTMIAGALVGLEFPLANQIYIQDLKKLGQQAGLIYAADLLGACLGAFLASIFLIPTLGIFQACFTCGLFKLATLILVVTTQVDRLKAEGR